jgi:DNA-3-methyladenine glycosylase I
MNYCEYCETLEKDNLHKIYHDTTYGFPVTQDSELFGRLILEINQAGLSWGTILKKQNNFREAYGKFDLKTVASYKEKDIRRLLSNSGIIRNKLKIHAIIYNAQQIIKLQESHGSFKMWLDLQYPLSKDEWVQLFKSIFKFTGGEITNEFLLSIGYLKGAHKDNCRINKNIMHLRPKWMNN